MILATISEDRAQIENFVSLNNLDKLEVRYRCHHSDLQRQEELREKIKQVFSPYSFRILKQAENNKRIAHVCGTFRFGNDPTQSVLDSNNQAYDIRNLFVVDSSFFPSSGTKNPSLTIAANALRVANFILKK